MIAKSFIFNTFKQSILLGQLDLTNDKIYISLIDPMPGVDSDIVAIIDDISHTTELLHFKVIYPNKLTSSAVKIVGPFNQDKFSGLVIHTDKVPIIFIPTDTIQFTPLSELQLSWEQNADTIAEI